MRRLHGMLSRRLQAVGGRFSSSLVWEEEGGEIVVAADAEARPTMGLGRTEWEAHGAIALLLRANRNKKK